MGNKIGITQILNKHKKLAEKENSNSSLDVDLIFFNIPITLEYYRQTKTYIEQISKSTNDVLTNTNFNELYLHKHNIIIKSDDIIKINNNNNPLDGYHQVEYYRENIIIFKHFDFIEDIDDIEPNELEEGLKKISEYENEIKLLEMKIRQEKYKILNLDYVKSRLHRHVPNVEQYIECVSYLHSIY